MEVTYLFMVVAAFLVVGAIGMSVVLWTADALIGRFMPTRQFRSPEEECGPHCRGCGYNLHGNVNGVCPECGTRRLGLPRTKEWGVA